jgi:hypothetical protein
MAVKRITDHDPLVVALITALFVWIVFDSVAFGLIAGLIGFLAVGKSQKTAERENPKS